MSSDNHWVDDVLVEAGSAFRPEPVGLELTLNGLQFSESRLTFEYPASTVHDMLGLEFQE